MGQQYKNLENKVGNRRKKRILFVNDDADTIAVIKTGLAHHGLEVETFVEAHTNTGGPGPRSHCI